MPSQASPSRAAGSFADDALGRADPATAAAAFAATADAAVPLPGPDDPQPWEAAMRAGDSRLRGLTRLQHNAPVRQSRSAPTPRTPRPDTHEIGRLWHRWRMGMP